MTQQDIFRLLLFILLTGNNQLSSGELDFATLNDLIIISLLFNNSQPSVGPSSCNCNNGSF
jgi:hypothetical protein